MVTIKVLIKNAYIVTMDDNKTIYPNGVIEIADSMITFVGEKSNYNESYFNEIIDAKGMLVTPGFHNVHTHSPSHVIKGVYDTVFHAIGMWYIHSWCANRTSDEIYTSALLGCIEMMKTGTVNCIDHAPVLGTIDYLKSPAGGRTDIDPIAEAYLQSKMKATLAVSVTDKEYTDIIPVDRAKINADLDARIKQCFIKTKPISEIMDLCRYTIRRWHGVKDKLQVMIAPTSPLRCSNELWQEVKKVSEEYDVGIHTHLLESKVQTEISQRVYGKTQVELLYDLGVLNEKLSCAHTVWVTDKDIEMLGAHRVSVVHNVGSNMRGSAGISPVYKLMQAGCNVALGADGSSSNGGQNVFTLTRLAIVAHRINQPDRSKWITSYDVMKMLTRNGARAALREKTTGSLEAGKKADIVIFDLDSVWMTPFNDPYNILAWAENGSSVDTVLIDGEVVVEKGKVLTIDEERVKKDCRELVRAIPIRNKEYFRVTEELTPILEEEHIRRLAK